MLRKARPHDLQSFILGSKRVYWVSTRGNLTHALMFSAKWHPYFDKKLSTACMILNIELEFIPLYWWLSSHTSTMHSALNSLSKYDCHLAAKINACMNFPLVLTLFHMTEDHRPCDFAFLSNYEHLKECFKAHQFLPLRIKAIHFSLLKIICYELFCINWKGYVRVQ